MSRRRPVVLVILDGWGWREEKKGNAIRLAVTPVWNDLWEKYPHTFLKTSGETVGLPKSTMGNSEVGHLTIGAGRIVFQDLTRISRAIADKSFFENPVFITACQKVKMNNTALHLVGLCSDVGVHAHLDHLDALLDLAKREGVKKVFIHAITDGRDSSPTSGKNYLARIERKAHEVGNARVATVCGRYYAMDRDKRWERTHKAWQAMVMGEGVFASSSEEAMKGAYEHGVTDEFILPTVITHGKQPVGTVSNDDAMLFFNFRADRARQLTRSLALPIFHEFSRARTPQLSSFVCMTEYDATFPFPVAFPVENVSKSFGEVVASHGLKQLRIAETEKYAHITFFFNGGNETLFPGEDRVLIQSPKDVATYDLKPEMSAEDVTRELLVRIDSNRYDVIILNFANPDMVGHTGNLPAAIRAVETVDACMGKLVPRVVRSGGTLLVTADHGNCEEMLDAHGQVLTAHTLNPVPLLLIGAKGNQQKLRDGGMLCDIAPTLLDLLELEKPQEMTGKSLLRR